MEVVILCGGKGTRLNSAYNNTPKPLVMINGKPLIWHIINIYDKFGYNEFVLPLGYGGDKIKEYFYNYEWMNHDFSKDFEKNKTILLQKPPKWKITFIDTGIETMTGARIKRIEKYISSDTFMLTYGDGLSDIDINQLIDYHKSKGKIATVTGIEKTSQYGILKVKDGIATSFDEKSKLDGIINGGFFVLNKKIFDYLSDEDDCIFEKEPLNKLATEGELAVYLHQGYWTAVDTYKDLLEATKTWK